ncbi:uncharacterized protein LOC120692700 [Panicum virgatum]|uniref:Uncharacterized protein n=1 Tax=Panicum virgatum TaxID=38727 RepID=A0A8T0MIR5_PANVG|nr:uncharacterized protein LOC120692700 [Panicum virgatum]KAG2537275.1 hypothetical protein PVAP13_9NG257900 [Panicum virgatum]KAG2537279.1 hypothetical protein PVAP13_9NG257900 [Panicum virgatum]KAG2537281.1 hypothetical protein PVAP13_9NG257900 [Panicum virgatum]
MGLDALPHGQAAGDSAHSGATSPAALRRSASERVPRDPSHFQFVDPAFFEWPASPLPPLMERPAPAALAPAAEAAMLWAPDAGCPRALQRCSRFDAHEVFLEPAKHADPAAGGTHGEIERRLRMCGIAEPAQDLEMLKQILEALQLNGLLHHTPTLPPHVRTASALPPIVVMRPNHRAQPQVQQPARLTPTRRLRVESTAPAAHSRPTRRHPQLGARLPLLGVARTCRSTDGSN